jgi:hypothetical protein
MFHEHKGRTMKPRLSFLSFLVGLVYREDFDFTPGQYVPWNAALNFHYLDGFVAKDRFQDQSIRLNFAITFCD